VVDRVRMGSPSVPFLFLDELGYLPIDKRGTDLMFQVVAARYESGSIVVTTNRKFRHWGKTFDVDNTLATAMIDRLMHHGEAILIEGDSYRTRDSQDEACPRCPTTMRQEAGPALAVDSSGPSSPFSASHTVGELRSSPRMAAVPTVTHRAV